MVADTDTGLHHDPKVRKLWRIVRDDALMNQAMCLLEGIRLASWGQGERVTGEDAAPFWIADIGPATEALIAAGLLDSDGLIPAKSWTSWFGPALERRVERAQAGARGGRKSAKLRRSSGEAELEQSFGSAQPNQPTNQPTNQQGRGVNGAREFDDSPAITPEIGALQRLAEELTGKPYVMANIWGGLGEKVVTEQLPHGLEKVEQAWRWVASKTKPKPTFRQLVLGADDVLNPIVRSDPKSRQDQDAQANFDRRVERTRKATEEYRQWMEGQR
jgi:hypothetical protein